MADKKISELEAILGSATADDDLLVIVDSSTNQTKKITKAELQSTINAALIDGAPAALDTLNEIAAALNDDANLYTTLTTQIDARVSKSGDTMTGDLTVPNVIVSGNVDGRDVSADGSKLDGIESGADVTDSTNVSAAGALMTTGGTVTGNINFGDNDKAVFGAGSDLQIYHDGSHSYISEQGTGNLRIAASDRIQFYKANLSEVYAQFIADGETEFYHNGVSKLTTTSTGIDVTGTVTADGLTVDGASDATIRFSNTGTVTSGEVLGTVEFYQEDGSSPGAGVVASIEARNTDAASGAGSIAFTAGYSNSNNDRMLINTNGDISFYEDTGTTPKFFWDASAESLGIGTSSLGEYDRELVINSLSSTAALRLAENNVNYFDIYHDGATNSGNIRLSGAGGTRFIQGSTETMRIDSSGNLLVGKSSPGILTDGIELGTRVESTADGTYALRLNRRNSDGDIAQFRKDGVPVGSIGVVGGSIIFGRGDTALAVNDGLDAVYPIEADGTPRDGAIDLGRSSYRWKDLYLSGGVYLGGTGSANKLDDYEEGTFTPSIAGITSPTYITNTGRYTKIGRQVHFEIDIDLAAGTATSSQIVIGNLPFTSISGPPYGGAVLNYQANFFALSGDSAVEYATFHFAQSNNAIYVYSNYTGGGIAGTNLAGTDGRIILHGQYTAA